jgi:hypothetical protein
VAEVVFDLVALAIEALGAVGFLGCIAARDHRQGTFVFDLLARGQPWSRRVQHFLDDLTVVDLAAGDGEVQRTAFTVDNGMDFRGPAAAADANRLLFLPPFPPLAQRCAFTIVLSMKYKPTHDLAAT